MCSIFKERLSNIDLEYFQTYKWELTDVLDLKGVFFFFFLFFPFHLKDNDDQLFFWVTESQ